MSEQEQILGAPVPGASSTASKLDRAMQAAAVRLGWSPQMQARLAVEMRRERRDEERRVMSDALIAVTCGLVRR